MYLMPLHCQVVGSLSDPSHFQFLEFLISTAMLTLSVTTAQTSKKKERESLKGCFDDKKELKTFSPVVGIISQTES